MMTLWILLHNHRFGDTAHVFKSEAEEEEQLPELDEIALFLGVEFENGREDEWLELCRSGDASDIPQVRTIGVSKCHTSRKGKET